MLENHATQCTENIIFGIQDLLEIVRRSKFRLPNKMSNSPPAKVIAAVAFVLKSVSFRQHLFQIGKDEYLCWVLQSADQDSLRSKATIAVACLPFRTL